MLQRTLIIAGLITVAVAIAVAVPMAMLALQGSHELRFEYVKSGGIAGVSEKYAFDSKTNIITFQGTSIASSERQLPDLSVQAIRHAIAGSGFFAMDSIPPKKGPADYFTYSLDITAEGATHSVSWVDDFASSQPVPTELKEIVKKIEEAYKAAS